MPNPPKEHQFKPGQSGNPNGRPKKKTLQELIERLAAERFDGDKTRAEAFVERLWEDAIAGKDHAVKHILDRHDGPVKNRTELTGENGGPLPVVFEIVDNRKADDDSGDGD